MEYLGRLATMFDRYWWIIAIIFWSLLGFLIVVPLLGIWRSKDGTDRNQQGRGE